MKPKKKKSVKTESYETDLESVPIFIYLFVYFLKQRIKTSGVWTAELMHYRRILQVKLISTQEMHHDMQGIISEEEHSIFTIAWPRRISTALLQEECQ